MHYCLNKVSAFSFSFRKAPPPPPPPPPPNCIFIAAKDYAGEHCACVCVFD